MADEKTSGGFRWWVQLFFAHFWKIVVIAVIAAYIFGWLPLPEPKELLDFIKEMR